LSHRREASYCLFKRTQATREANAGRFSNSRHSKPARQAASPFSIVAYLFRAHAGAAGELQSSLLPYSGLLKSAAAQRAMPLIVK
jgi:hypothetical protein